MCFSQEPNIFISLIFQRLHWRQAWWLCASFRPLHWPAHTSWLHQMARRSCGAQQFTPSFQDQEELYTRFILSAVSAPCAGLEKEMLVFTCSCFHLGKLRKRDNLWLIIFQVSACIKVRTLFTACGPYVLAGSWKDKVDTHQTLPPQHVPVCSVTQSCLWLFATPWTVAARVYPSNPLEWVAVFSSRGSSQPRDQTHLSLAQIVKPGNF